MEVRYETEELREIFCFPAKAIARFGANVARLLAVRFADIRALSNAAELDAFSTEYRTVGGFLAIELEIGENYSIFIVNNHVDKPPDGDDVDWAKVKRVKILCVARNHEPI